MLPFRPHLLSLGGGGRDTGREAVYGPWGFDGEPAPVDADGHLDRGVVRLLLDVDGGDAARDRQRAERVPQAVGLEAASEPGGLEPAFHGATHTFRGLLLVSLVGPLAEPREHYPG